MYKYNLIIKRGSLDEPATHAMVNRELTTRFGPAVHYITTAILDNEVVVIVSDESKRNLQTTLGEWFADHASMRTFPVGTLLHYRQILSGEPIHNKLGG
jgi:hypothetical protein